MNTSEEKSLQEKIKNYEEWKKLYTYALIDFLNPQGDVLEIGFRQEMAAEGIQKYHPQSHTIIVSDGAFAEKARQWASRYPGTKVIEGNWETQLKELGTFDAIFYHGDLALEDEIAIIHFLFPEESLKKNQEAKELLEILQEKVKQVKRQFSDQEIEDFYQTTGKLNPDELALFFKNLKEHGNISNAQYEESLKKYKIADQQLTTPAMSPEEVSKPDAMLLLLEECLTKHMKQGSRFSSFGSNQTSKYEDVHFFETIITNSDVDYQESTIPIKLPDKTRQGLLFVVEKITQ